MYEMHVACIMKPLKRSNIFGENFIENRVGKVNFSFLWRPQAYYEIHSSKRKQF